MRRFEKLKVCLLVLAIGLALCSHDRGDATPYWDGDDEVSEIGALPGQPQPGQPHIG